MTLEAVVLNELRKSKLQQIAPNTSNMCLSVRSGLYAAFQKGSKITSPQFSWKVARFFLFANSSRAHTHL